MNYKGIFDQIDSTNNTIKELENQRTRIIKENSNVLIRPICDMMDWEIEDFECVSVNFSKFEFKIMVEIRLKVDNHARWVFEVDSSAKPTLRFREDFSKSL